MNKMRLLIIPTLIAPLYFSSISYGQSGSIANTEINDPSILIEIFKNIDHYSEDRQLFSLWLADSLLPSEGTGPLFVGFEKAASAGALNVLNNLTLSANNKISEISSSLRLKFSAALNLDAADNAVALLIDGSSSLVEPGDFDSWFSIHTEPTMEYTVEIPGCPRLIFLALKDNVESSKGGTFYDDGRNTFKSEQEETLHFKIRAPECENSRAIVSSKRQSISVAPGSSPAFPQSITLENTYVSSMLKDETQWFSFRPEPDITYQLEVKPSGEFDSVLSMFDSNDNTTTPLETDDDSGTDRGSIIRFQQSERELVYFQVSEYTNRPGRYEIAISEKPSLSGLAQQIEIGKPQDSTDETNRDGDMGWWVFTAEKDATYALTASSLEEGDTLLKIYDSNEQMSDSDDDGGSGLSSRLRFTAPESGDYLFSVEDISGSYVSYQVGVSLLDITPRELIPNDELNGNFTSSQLEQYWQFQSEAGISYEIETFPAGSVDTYIKLYRESNNELIASDDDGGTALGSKLTFKGDGKSYRLEVESLDGDTGQFKILMRRP